MDIFINELDRLTGGDPEVAHVEAEKIVMRYLRASGSAAVADAFERARDRVGFWYA